MNFHLITHAVCAAVIATLVRKYLYVSYQFDELEILYDSCTTHIERQQSPNSWQHDDIVENYRKEHVEEEQTSHAGFGRNMNNFDNTLEMEYFNDYSESVDDQQEMDDYTGTKFSKASQEKVIDSESTKSKYILASTVLGQDNTDATVSPSSVSVIVNAQNTKDQQNSNQKPGAKYTSVWCNGANTNERTCHFENLCYHTRHKDFIFFQHKDSLQENVPENVNFVNILDMSSVADHNLHYFSLTKLPSEAMTNFNPHWIHTTSLIFNRFKPDNIMHILHDDIFPLIHTLKQITFNSNNVSTLLADETLNQLKQKQKYDIQLVAMEDWREEIDFDFLYDILVQHKLLTKESLEKTSDLVCFQDSYIGISKATTWYQYGFYKPQGPVDKVGVTGFHIHQSVNYILTHISRDCPLCTSGQFLVLISRKNNRRILNEMDLSLTIAQKVGMRVMSVSLETHSLEDIINIVHQSKGIIGMHGSLLSLSAFLQPGTILIELFPFAVNPTHYTPYKTLVKLPNMDITYEAWVNTDKKNTQMHPDNAPELGGIDHLDDKRRKEIVEQTEVPLHLCCDDPSWLFHIYQDTVVGIPQVIKLIEDSMLRTKQSNSGSVSSYIHDITPGSVSNVQCLVVSSSLSVTWSMPWNLKYLVQKTVSYELWYQNTKDNSTSSLILPNVTSHSISSISAKTEYLIWIRCILNDVQGSFSSPGKCIPNNT